MGDEQKSRFKYTQEEKDTLKVLKMQENDLHSLVEDSDSQTRELEELRCRVERLAKRLNVDVIPKAKDDGMAGAPLNISKEDIPTWESLVDRANKEIEEDVVYEDLLSKEEFDYCIEDIERINNEFSQKTSIWSKRDLSFLAIATGLQTARWIILQEIFGDLGAGERGARETAEQGDARKKKETHEYNERHKNRENVKSEHSYPTWRDIIFGQYARIDGGKTKGVCPYDAQTGAPAGFEDGGRGNHRVNTMGHDPLLGWIFGTANLMTCSISLSKRFGFANYHVDYPGGVFGASYSYPEMFYDVFQSIMEDKNRLLAALFAQGAHMRSDINTERGLPIPLLEVFSEELAGKLYSEQYDQLCLLKDLRKVGAQAAFSILINMIIGVVHKMFYDESKDGKDKNHYEVRTRKILLISNLLASSGNVLYCAFSEDWKKLDVGGILVSLYRLFSDVRFMTRVKQEFIQSHLDATISDTIREIDSHFID